MSTQKLFLIGPGFIGRALLDVLVADGGFAITCLSRRAEHARALEDLGVATVAGTLDDFELIAAQTAASDVVVHAATADHLRSARAVLEGVRRKVCGGRDGGIYIHTSGTSVLDDGANGRFKSDAVFSDDRPDEIDALDPGAPHREIDLEIATAFRGEFGSRAKMAIIIPPLVYGYNTAHARTSIQIPTLARFALKHGFAGHVGAGRAVESQVHVNDLARGYAALLAYLRELPAVEVGKVLTRNPYFFCENGREASWREVGEEIGRALHDAGRIANAEPREIPRSMWGDLFGPATAPVIGLNSRSRAVRLRQLGWKPREKGVWESFREDELPAILEQAQGDFAGYKGTVA